MKKNLISIVVISLLIVIPMNSSATSGRLRGNSIVTCNGIMYGQHGDGHWHQAQKNDDGNYSAIGDPIASNPCSNTNNGNTTNNDNNSSNSSNNNSGSKSNNNSNGNKNNNSNSNTNTNKTTTVSKSSIATLETVKVDGESVDILDEMNYSTNNSVVNIEATSTHAKATVDYEKEINLTVGTNEIILKVTAEDGTTKTYKLIINREEVVTLSGEVGIKVTVNGQEVEFDSSKKGKVINIGSEDELDIKYVLEDSNSTTDLEYNKEIKQGETAKIKFSVTAQNGDIENYEFEIHRYTKGTQTVSTIICFGLLGGLGYGSYKVVKKVKNKKTK